MPYRPYSPLPPPYIPCPRPRWPSGTPPPGPRPFRMSPQSPSGGPRLVQCPSPEYFYAAPPGMVLPPPPTAGSPMHLQEHPVVPLEPRPMSARGFSSDYEEEMASRGGSSSRAGRGFRYDSDGGYAAEYDDYDEYEDEEGRRHRRSRQSTADIIASQSQEYVDEKLAEYQATIHQLQVAGPGDAELNRLSRIAVNDDEQVRRRMLPNVAKLERNEARDGRFTVRWQQCLPGVVSSREVEGNSPHIF
ncbi:protein PAF1 homolog [Ischnura elegans]|uniref:protein PAF1 homolog n=1 Tax=Ischnura elegans TaxID=197161 RepID=UPI001ED86BB8|nr:protein PAF1 homolog [Ischnura elegans]